MHAHAHTHTHTHTLMQCNNFTCVQERAHRRTGPRWEGPAEHVPSGAGAQKATGGEQESVHILPEVQKTAGADPGPATEETGYLVMRQRQYELLPLPPCRPFLPQHYNTTHSHALHTYTLFPVQLCKETCILLCPACCIVDEEDVFCTYLCTSSQCILWPQTKQSLQPILIPSDPAAVLRDGPFLQRRCVLWVWWQADECGLCVSLCLLSGPLGCPVSMCPLLSWQPHRPPQCEKAFQQKCVNHVQKFESSVDVWNLFCSVCVVSLFCTHTP